MYRLVSVQFCPVPCARASVYDSPPFLVRVSVDYMHSETSVTPLMVAVSRGFVAVAEQLLNMGANFNVRSINEWTAMDYARKFNQEDTIELLEAYMWVDHCRSLLRSIPVLSIAFRRQNGISPLSKHVSFGYLASRVQIWKCWI